MTDDILPRIRWRIEVDAGTMIPDGYGVVYLDWMRSRAVCMPVPINLIVASWRALVRWLRFPPWLSAESRSERREADAWDDGYDYASWARWVGFAVKRDNPYRRPR